MAAGLILFSCFRVWLWASGWLSPWEALDHLRPATLAPHHVVQQDGLWSGMLIHLSQSSAANNKLFLSGGSTGKHKSGDTGVKEAKPAQGRTWQLLCCGAESLPIFSPSSATSLISLLSLTALQQKASVCFHPAPQFRNISMPVFDYFVYDNSFLFSPFPKDSSNVSKKPENSKRMLKEVPTKVSSTASLFSKTGSLWKADMRGIRWLCFKTKSRGYSLPKSSLIS